MGGWSNDNRDEIEWLGDIKAKKFKGDGSSLTSVTASGSLITNPIVLTNGTRTFTLNQQPSGSGALLNTNDFHILATDGIERMKVDDNTVNISTILNVNGAVSASGMLITNTASQDIEVIVKNSASGKAAYITAYASNSLFAAINCITNPVTWKFGMFGDYDFSATSASGAVIQTPLRISPLAKDKSFKINDQSNVAISNSLLASGAITTLQTMTASNAIINFRARVGPTNSNNVTLIANNNITGDVALLVGGKDVSGNSNDGSGIAFVGGYNTNGNRQMWFGDRDNYGNASYGFFRYTFFSNTLPIIDAVKADGSTRLPVQIGADSTTGVIFNNGTIAVGGSQNTPFDVYSTSWFQGNVQMPAGFTLSAVPTFFNSGNSPGTPSTDPNVVGYLEINFGGGGSYYIPLYQ